MTEQLISTRGKSPIILSQRDDRPGVVILQGRNRLYLDDAEVANLRAVLDRPRAVSPAKAVMQSFTAPTA